jgi:hypothetical protein
VGVCRPTLKTVVEKPLWDSWLHLFLKENIRSSLSLSLSLSRVSGTVTYSREKLLSW